MLSRDGKNLQWWVLEYLIVLELITIAGILVKKQKLINQNQSGFLIIISKEKSIEVHFIYLF